MHLLPHLWPQPLFLSHPCLQVLSLICHHICRKICYLFHYSRNNIQLMFLKQIHTSTFASVTTCFPSFTHLLQHLSHHLSPYLSPHLAPHQQKKHCKHFTIPLQNIPCDKCWKNPSRNAISSNSRYFVLQSHLHIAVSANIGFYQ